MMFTCIFQLFGAFCALFARVCPHFVSPCLKADKGSIVQQLFPLKVKEKQSTLPTLHKRRWVFSSGPGAHRRDAVQVARELWRAPSTPALSREWTFWLVSELPVSRGNSRACQPSSCKKRCLSGVWSFTSTLPFSQNPNYVHFFPPKDCEKKLWTITPTLTCNLS